MDVMAPLSTAQNDLMRAALLGVFDPRSLVGDDSDRLSSLAKSAIEQELNGQWYWTLTPDARVTGLSLLPGPGSTRTQLLNELPTLLPGDQLGAALRVFLNSRASKDIATMIADAQSDRRWRLKQHTHDPNVLAQALKLLTEAGVTLPDWAADPATARALRRAVVLDRRAQAAHMLLPTPFRGRGREMRVLETYIRTGTLRDPAANPVLDPMEEAAPPHAITALAVIGMGGTGKSALIEALSRSVETDQKVTFLEFDLDQTSLRAGERVAITMELTRQIGLFHPELDQRLSTIRRQLRERLSASGEKGASLDQSASAVLSALSELGRLLGDVGLVDHGFALVFDTFEQALVAGEQRVRLIADWLVLLRDVGRMKNLRVILSGREADLVAKFDTPELRLVGRIELGDLGTNAGRAKLRDMFRRFGIKHLDQVPALISAYGSNPLVIEIVANFCRDRSKRDIRNLAKGDETLVGELNAEKVQRFLYTRTLERIRDEDLRPLASPGLILRRITPELIEQVLAEPCGMETPLPEGKAVDLYERLSRQVWLVRKTRDGNALEHVPDLRRVMLPQILSLPTAKDVLDAAAAWFGDSASNMVSSDDHLEAQYYAILRDPGETKKLYQAELMRLSDYLGASVQDFDPKAQAVLREATGALLTREEINLLRGDARTRAASKRSARQVDEGLERSVLDEISSDADADGNDEARTDVYRALFADAAFMALSLQAGALTQPVFDAAFDMREPQRDEFFDLTHTGWLATLATLDLSTESLARQTQQDSIIAAAGVSLRQRKQKYGDSEQPRQPGFLTPSESLARLILGMTEREDSLFPPMVQPWAQDPERPDLFVVSSLVDWRVALVETRQYPDTSAKRVVNLQLGMLPFLNPAVIKTLLSVHPSIITPTLQRKGNAAFALARFRNDAPVALNDISGIRNLISTQSVEFRLPAMTVETQQAIAPGLLPEFHAPLRLFLEEQGPSETLVSAIASVADQLPWWPPELAAEKFGTEQHGPTLISTLLDLADCAGVLPELARVLADAFGKDSKAARISRLIDSFRDLVRGSIDTL